MINFYCIFYEDCRKKIQLYNKNISWSYLWKNKLFPLCVNVDEIINAEGLDYNNCWIFGVNKNGTIYIPLIVVHINLNFKNKLFTSLPYDGSINAFVGHVLLILCVLLLTHSVYALWRRPWRFLKKYMNEFIENTTF